MGHQHRPFPFLPWRRQEVGSRNTWQPARHHVCCVPRLFCVLIDKVATYKGTLLIQQPASSRVSAQPHPQKLGGFLCCPLPLPSTSLLPFSRDSISPAKKDFSSCHWFALLSDSWGDASLGSLPPSSCWESSPQRCREQSLNTKCKASKLVQRIP